MRNLVRLFVLCISLSAGVADAAEYLVRFEKLGQDQERFLARHGGTLKLVSEAGVLFKWTTNLESALDVATWDSGVAYIQPNRTIQLPTNPSIAANREALIRAVSEMDSVDILTGGGTDNPAIQKPASQASGSDPLLSNAWGVQMIGATQAWGRSAMGRGVIVAVTDTGVDYNHEDLINNMWRNPGEVADDGVDNDRNGYVDDIVGWDFATNDNKPYDLTVDLLTLIFGGGNPGHGTHVAGAIAARYNNRLGIAGVAPSASIMALRFITEQGQGTTESAIQCIDYAVKNGAKVINASWGGEKGNEDDTALSEAIRRAESAGVIFVAAAGNGRQPDPQSPSAGFDNDTDPKPMIPATLPIANIVSVAAIDSNEELGSFSNFGVRSVKLGAPGVKVLSTVPGNEYQDTVIDIPFLGLKATWDGTSMASPHVAGAMALVWADHPSMTYTEVINAVLKATTPVAALRGKVATGGRLDLRQIP